MNINDPTKFTFTYTNAYNVEKTSSLDEVAKKAFTVMMPGETRMIFLNHKLLVNSTGNYFTFNGAPCIKMTANT